MTVTPAALGSSAQAQKKQVKRHHRRKRSSCTARDCVETSGQQEQRDRSEPGEEREEREEREKRDEKRERPAKTRRELPARFRCSVAPQSDSTSDDEASREAPSWSKEKARRGRRRERDGANGGKGGEDRTEVMELQSVGSDEGRENLPLVEGSGGLKKRLGASIKGDGSQRGGKERSLKSGDGSSLAEDAEELIAASYQEKGSGSGDMSVPTPQKHCGMNGGTQWQYTEDSETEVCRLVGSEKETLGQGCKKIP